MLSMHERRKSVSSASVIWYIVVRPKRPRIVHGKDCHLTQVKWVKQLLTSNRKAWGENSMKSKAC
jgi:hypothetical protein